MPQRFSPGGEKTADRHRNNAEDERSGAELDDSAAERPRLHGQAKKDVGEAKSKKRDVPEPDESPRMRVVTAEPVLAMKEKTDDRARENATQRGGPAGKQIPISCDLHTAIVG